MEWKWDSRLETGIEKIDEQHKELFHRIDKLDLALYKGEALPELIKIMEYMEHYVIEHFEMEERLMLDAGYPGYAAHAAQHNQFRNIYSEILADFQNHGSDSYLAIDVDKRLRKWWENHILKTDMNYIPFLKSFSGRK